MQGTWQPYDNEKKLINPYIQKWLILIMDTTNEHTNNIPYDTKFWRDKIMAKTLTSEIGG